MKKVGRGMKKSIHMSRLQSPALRVLQQDRSLSAVLRVGTGAELAAGIGPAL